MKIKSRRARRRRWAIERLESRMVLDAEAGAPVSSEQFGSDDELNQYLVDLAVERYSNLFGTEASWWYPGYPIFLNDGQAFSSPSGVADRALESNGSLAGVSFDGTNVQIGGIDESDVVKTDGEFIYVASGTRVSIIDARHPNELSIAAEIELANWTNDLYIAGDRLVVISHQFQAWAFDSLRFAADILPFPSAGPQTIVAVYDVADHAAPELVSETKLDGNLITSRLIDDHMYLVSSDGLNLPYPETHCEPIPEGDESQDVDANGNVIGDVIRIAPPIWQFPPTQRCVYESQEEYVARVGDNLAEEVLPSYELLDGTGQLVASGDLTSATEIDRPTIKDPYSVTSIVVLDVAANVPGPVDAVTEIGDYSSTVFVSADNIYLASQSWDENGVTSTQIRQYAISEDGSEVDTVASGEVPGVPLNQFALDEFDDHLRIATTSWSPERSSGVYVLQREGADLNVVGSLEGLAPGESIFAARFLGDQAFLVTFRQIDPLFTIDLTDPTDPQVAGELKIPGFSNYLQPVGEGLIVGLGRDENSAPQFSLFDATDFSHPQRVDQVTMSADGWGWSDAFYNHHAVSYFADAGVLVVPFQGGNFVCLNNSMNGSCEQQSLNQFWVLAVDASSDDPLSVLGTIEPTSGQPLRSFRIGDNLFTVSSETVAVHPLSDPATRIDELYFGSLAHDDSLTADVDLGEQSLDVLINDHASDSLTIVELGATTSGGEVTISEDGRSVLYTPLDDNAAWGDSFSYTVEGGGRRGTATVYVQLVRTSAQDKMVELARQDLAARLKTVVELNTQVCPAVAIINADGSVSGPPCSPHHFRSSQPQDGIDAASIEIVEVRSTTWNDSCLGIANSGVACAQVLTPGFHVNLDYQGHTFEYHTDEDQTVILASSHLQLGDDRLEVATGERRLRVLDNDNLFGLYARIVSVSTPKTGSVRIAGDGQSLWYTPGDDSTSGQLDEFSYEVELAEGIRGRANVKVIGQGDNGHLVRVRAEVVDAIGQSVSHLEVGETAVLNLYVEDLREVATGVFAVYADVEFDPTLAGELGDIDHGRLYVNHTGGAVQVQDGLIDEIGGVSLVTDDGDVLTADRPGELLFASISFVAQHTGQLEFMLDAADDLPNNDTLLLDLNEPVSVSRIDFVSTLVDIGSPWRNHVDPRDATGDGVVSPRDVLVLVNYLNAAGTRRLDAELARTTLAAAPEEPLMRMDVNGDGYISPLDALIIINALRNPTAEGEASPVGEELTQATSTVDTSSVAEPIGMPINRSVADQGAPLTATSHPRDLNLADPDPVVSAIDSSVEALVDDLRHNPSRNLAHDGLDSFFADLATEGDLLVSSPWDL